ncbi:CD276 antigen-like isoform X2 [Girardinichthys multiradiatus]|uniref:CD276 antigen-like isoform X2 n=1 Tax=Girardinichthys multiradiatus TaxID=208333 RepID=UPI001FADCD84|nr:CD276 antigen-like isoform X2 [Girardinichthys multiradiatus]
MELMPVIWLLVCTDLVLTENAKDPDLVCPSEPIEAVRSKDVVLPCHLEPPTDASAETVSWRQGEHVVHLHQGGKDHPSEQGERFKGRTSLFSEGLTEGNLSLTLSSVNVHDDGRYQCSLHTESLNKMCYINLSVEPLLVCPSGHIEVTSDDDVVLPCHLEPPVDASGEAVEWRWGNNTVLLYERGKYIDAEKKDRFKGRTFLFTERLTEGNLSLKLFSVPLRDNGTYQCFFRSKSQDKSCSVILTVDEPEVMGSDEPVTAEVGDDVILPCHVEPSANLTKLTVEWRCNNSMVHLYRSQKDVPEMQDERFRNRTSLFHEELVHGNVSLKLTNVTKEDAGNYSCYIPRLTSKVKRGNVTLNVVSPDQCTCPESCHYWTLGLGLGIPLVVCIVIIFFLWNKYVKNRGFAEPGGENDNHVEKVTNIPEGE